MTKNEYLGDDVRYQHIKQLQKWAIPLSQEAYQFMRRYENQLRQQNKKPED